MALLPCHLQLPSRQNHGKPKTSNLIEHRTAQSNRCLLLTLLNENEQYPQTNQQQKISKKATATEDYHHHHSPSTWEVTDRKFLQTQQFLHHHSWKTVGSKNRGHLHLDALWCERHWPWCTPMREDRLQAPNPKSNTRAICLQQR